MATRWWWIRHAPVHVAGKIIYGQLDVDCDTSDHARAVAVAAQCPTDPVLVISGLGRTRATLDALQGAGLTRAPDVRVEPDLMEQSFGAWEGKTWRGLKEDDDPALERFWAQPFHEAPPGGESFETMTRRVQSCVARLQEELAGRDIVAVTHAGTIRAVLAEALAIPVERLFNLNIEPLSLTRVDHDRKHWAGPWQVRGVNL